MSNVRQRIVAPQKVNLSFTGPKFARDGNLPNVGTDRIVSGERLFSVGGFLQTVTMAKQTLMYKLVRALPGEGGGKEFARTRCSDAIQRNCAENERIPLFVSFAPNFGYGDWACLIQTIRPTKLLVFNKTNMQQLLLFLTKSGAPPELISLANQILIDHTVQMPHSWTHPDDYYKTLPPYEKPWEYLAEEDQTYEKLQSLGDLFANDHLVPGALSKPVSTRYSDMDLDTKFFAGLRPYLKKLGVDGIWSPSKFGQGGLWGDTHEGDKPDRRSVGKVGEYFRSPFPEEAVIYDCSAVQLIGQVPLKAIQEQVDLIIKSALPVKTDLGTSELVSYLQNSCCDPHAITKFIELLPHNDLKKGLSVLRDLLTGPAVTLPKTGGRRRDKSKRSRSKPLRRSRATSRCKRCRRAKITKQR